MAPALHGKRPRKKQGWMERTGTKIYQKIRAGSPRDLSRGFEEEEQKPEASAASGEGRGGDEEGRRDFSIFRRVFLASKNKRCGEREREWSGARRSGARSVRRGGGGGGVAGGLLFSKCEGGGGFACCTLGFGDLAV